MRGGIRMSKTQWYTKSTYLLVALALVLSLGLVAVPMAGTVEANGGEDYYVATTGNNANDGLSWATAWKTITHAVENSPVTTGDVIHVADGLYNPANGENFPIDFITNGVSLIGAGGDTSIIDSNNQETNILNIWVNGVSISDFELRNAEATWWASTGNGIYMNAADDCHISNVEIYHLTQGSGTAAREPAGIFMENGSSGNTFNSIEIYDISSEYQPRGIWCHDCSGNQFTDIYIHDVNNTGMLTDSAAYGIHLSSCEGNTFDDIRINSISGGEWGEGIQVSWLGSNTFGDLSISNIYGGQYAYGILLLESSDNIFGSNSEICYIDAEGGLSIGVAMECNPSSGYLGSNRNTFESFDIHNTCYGFKIEKSDDNFITKCNIHDNYSEGVHICSGCFESTGNKLNCNNIYDNADYGVYKEYTPSVDATGNWWGDAHGPSHSPGNGDKVSDNVAYDPYLSFQFQYCGQCGGAIPQPSAVPAVDHWGIAAMITLFAGLLVWRVRRRRLAS
jgi:hypothetical protein